ncbi:YybH family protein [Filimonas effusa]|uniref:DUF4440 domain-containing protein n=1 Tax=Filimonas effusa TaxID=2508721 RepID=A0A4Q1D500_9BACT|nr:DUF4440 domain-containing protein [Filimonas effusa]RXK83550.1 DUF4440 domain-containing protein [Filimonas effusa]
MRTLLAFAFMLVVVAGKAQEKDELKIRALLTGQTGAWNRGDLEAFMIPYWHSDSLLFIGKSGVNRGWDKTLASYKKGYPDTTAMGKLQFDILEVRRLSDKNFFVVGKWHLERTIGNLEGHFTLLWRKIKGQWCIVADHSS